MSKPYEVTLTNERVVLYVSRTAGCTGPLIRADLTPEQARDLARDLMIHADDVDAITQDALEQMS